MRSKPSKNFALGGTHSRTKSCRAATSFRQDSVIWQDTLETALDRKRGFEFQAGERVFVNTRVGCVETLVAISSLIASMLANMIDPADPRAKYPARVADAAGRSAAIRAD
ncbi:MAG: hypothetical protein SGJ19_17585 [Planctomycetia bacterium]|nr:hypothetical protein [Planctomycetia bacterium]